MAPCLVILLPEWWELRIDDLLKAHVVKCLLANLALDTFVVWCLWDVVKVCLQRDGLHLVSDVLWQLLNEGVLEGDHRVVEELAWLGFVGIGLSFKVVVVDIDDSWMVNILGDHLWEEVAQQDTHSLNVLFASEEYFFSSDCWLPELLKGVSIIFIKNTLVQ